MRSGNGTLIRSRQIGAGWIAPMRAMREVWRKFPKDPDAGALFAEAMMDLRPWDQWTPEGKPQPGTDEILATLDAVLKLNPNHPLANHLYIHAVEASPNPERAIAAADRLRNLQPGLAHNVHMPSHIDIRTGRWLQAVETNAKAVQADQQYRNIFGTPRDVLNVYIAHNRHMLAYAAMMSGQRDLAIKHIRAMVAEMPADFLEENALHAEGFMAMPLEVMVRFGLWNDILTEPEKYTEKMWFTRDFIMLPARSRPRRKAARPTPATSSEFFSNAASWSRKKPPWAITAAKQF